MFKDSDYAIDMESEQYKLNKPIAKRKRSESSDEEQDVSALQNILGDTIKPKEKQKEMQARVSGKTKARNMERIAPIPEFKRKDGQKTAQQRRTERKQRFNEGKRILTPTELRNKRNSRRVAIPINRLQKK